MHVYLKPKVHRCVREMIFAFLQIRMLMQIHAEHTLFVYCEFVLGVKFLLANVCCLPYPFIYQTLQLVLPFQNQKLPTSEFCVRPSAPPSPFTASLFCLCAWMITMNGKVCRVFRTVKFPLMNSSPTSGWICTRLAISRTCTDAHLA